MTVDPEERLGLFDDQLLEYEIFLEDFFLDIATQKRTNLKIALINTYLLIHNGLTQNELKTLSDKIYKRTKNKVRKMSIGAISTYLSVLSGFGVKKQRIEGTHKYEYRFPVKIESTIDIGIEMGLESFLKLEVFLNQKKKDLKKLEKESKKGASELNQNIEDLLEVFDYYRTLFKQLHSEGVKK